MNDNDRPKRYPDDEEPADTDSGKATFTGFEDDDDYEEPDRDTDYGAAYPEDDLEAEEFADTLFEQELDEELEAGDLTEAERAERLASDLWEEPEDLDDARHAADEEEAWTQAASEPEPVLPLAEPPAAVDDDWDDSLEPAEDEADGKQGWPLTMIAVSIVALILLGVGGYGVIEQRSADQEEIRRLQAALATFGDPAEAAANRDALREAEREIGELRGQVESLTLDNRTLVDTVAGLESQLNTQRLDPAPAAGDGDGDGSSASQEPVAEEAEEKVAMAPAVTDAGAVQADPAPAPAAPATVTDTPAEAAKATTAASPGGGWFVNFASYGRRDTADSWAARLQPSAGSTRVISVDSGDRPLYRVRIVDLPDKATADRVARELAKKHGLPALWVGKG